MGKRVPYGIADFKTIREDGLLYIDKTMYIEKLEAQRAVIFTRPRRFRKINANKYACILLQHKRNRKF